MKLGTLRGNELYVAKVPGGGGWALRWTPEPGGIIARGRTPEEAARLGLLALRRSTDVELTEKGRALLEQALAEEAAAQKAAEEAAQRERELEQRAGDLRQRLLEEAELGWRRAAPGRYVRGPWAVVRRQDRRGLWELVHVPSGRLVYSEYRSARDARLAAHLLSGVPGVDWESERPVVPGPWEVQRRARDPWDWAWSVALERVRGGA